MEKVNKMESMPMKRLVISMSLPIMISMVIQALYNIVDSIFVSMISANALTAVSLAYPVQTLMVAFACGSAVGFNTLLARFLGEKKFKEANNTVMHGILLALFNGVLFAFIGFFFSDTFLRCYSKKPEILAMGNTYIRICTFFSFAIFVQIIYERIMQATGNAIYNMVMQSIGAIANIILDPILIFGCFGLPAMGIKGAAIATVIGQILGMLSGYLLTKYKVYDVEVKVSYFHLDFSILKRIFQVGIPAICMQSVLSFMTVFMNMILNPFSSVAVSVFSIYYKLQNFMNMAILGITNALIPILSYNYGAKCINRMKEAVRFSLLLAIVIMFFGMLLFECCPYSLMHLFHANEEMIYYGIPALRIISLSFIFAGITMILSASFQALNHAQISLWITLARQLILLLPLTYWLAHQFGLNVAWFSFFITELICAFLSLKVWLHIKKLL